MNDRVFILGFCDESCDQTPLFKQLRRLWMREYDNWSDLTETLGHLKSYNRANISLGLVQRLVNRVKEDQTKNSLAIIHVQYTRSHHLKPDSTTMTATSMLHQVRSHVVLCFDLLEIYIRSLQTSLITCDMNNNTTNTTRFEKRCKDVTEIPQGSQYSQNF